MTRKGTALGLVTLLAILMPQPAGACTTFCLKHDGEWVFGKNLDWMVEKGIVVVNKRYVAKASSPDSGAVQWISKYGSVTFNMYGRELPMSGMNEAGLVIENMWLPETQYPPEDSRPATNSLQWIQYQLDTAATVDEVMASDSTLRIGNAPGAPLHFLVCDTEGGCATVEFLDGRMVCHRGDSLPVAVLANSTYEASLNRLKAIGEDIPASASCTAGNSLERFCKAASMGKEYSFEKQGSPIDYAFATLDSVSNDSTQWSVVYDPAGGRIYFKTRSNGSARHFDTGAFDFSCDTKVKILDMNTGASGDVSKDFVSYTFEKNYEQVTHAFSRTGFLKDTPEETLRSIAAMPESMQCVR